MLWHLIEIHKSSPLQIYFCGRNTSAAWISVGSEIEKKATLKVAGLECKTCRPWVCVRYWPSQWARSFLPFWVLCFAERCRRDDVLPATADIMTRIYLWQQNTVYANLEKQKRSLVHSIWCRTANPAELVLFSHWLTSVYYSWLKCFHVVDCKILKSNNLFRDSGCRRYLVTV